ncbi:MAG: DUF6498-containing protein [Pseudomonadota bacterium]
MIQNTTSSSTTEPKARDYSGLAVIAANVFTIVLAFVENWDIRPLLIIYWAQSVIIGVSNFFRMVFLKDFSTEGLTSNGEPVPETEKGKWSTAIFFAIHYGFFHVVYAVFVFGAALGGDLDDKFGGTWEPGSLEQFAMVIAVAVFAVGHWFSFRTNVEADLKGRPNLGKMMFLPYARIIPMHLTIIFGFGFGSNRYALLLFLALKTGADWLMHVVEHQVLQKPSKQTR